MLTLNGTTEKVQVVLGGAVTTDELVVMVSAGKYGDVTLTDGDTPIDALVGVADEGVGMEYVHVYNKDTVQHTVTISKKVGSTTYNLVKRNVPSGSTLTWDGKSAPVVTPAMGEAAAGAGASAHATVVAAEGGSDNYHKTVLTLTDTPITITDALAYAGIKLYDLPAGRIRILDCLSSLTFTTTSVLASTLNAGVTVSYGIGSVTASATTLATTMQNMMPGSGETPKTFTSSATINVASSAATGFLAAVSAAQLAAIIDGTTTPVDVYLNVAVPTGTDIDGDATITVNGTITLTWVNLGDF